MPRRFKLRPFSASVDCRGGSTSARKSLGMHTFNSPMLPTDPPAIVAIASSVVWDVIFRILADLLQSYAAVSSASATLGFAALEQVVHSPGAGYDPRSSPALSRGGASPVAQLVRGPPLQESGGVFTISLVGARR